ncbi:hypothetical protein D1869_05795 [Sulfurisphaera ohwakuensis]|uniref:Membrane-associated HD superfamily phosphohydrolase n=2 Tax=Sulfurisphaera ohwakuensis TaxID=69656 RepID=A0A650CFY3_SULOH|nr:hypothetical protein [Sulfurisphaera ohwakuensis]MBB5255048.1 membrane-associated HD superfamily phosphohydrolase [Sulfurisphaera ohwakuensis]QGR16754.1 hypothetical protein D1869_05795 [Sulfurisphaera ohwakuensis]
MSPIILSSFLISPSLFGIMFSSLAVGLFIDDRQNGLLEFLVAEGFKPEKIFYIYAVSYLLVSVPIDALISGILGVFIHNLAYFVILLTNSIGISWIVVPVSMYFAYLQRVTGSSRSLLGTYIGVGLLFVLIYSSTIVTSETEVEEILLYSGIVFLVVAVLLTILIGKNFSSEKLIS